jgi:hypothetical protein
MLLKKLIFYFFKYVQMFLHKSKGKRRAGNSLSSSQAWSGTSANLFAVMVLLNFDLHMLIYY